MSYIGVYKIEKDHIRENINKYTRKTFALLPKIDNPHILDVGCGTGVPTLEIAEISRGFVIGLDNDENSLRMLRRKIKARGLDNQVRVINDSILTMDFPEESFDIIWAEGSVFVLGFGKSMKIWRHLLNQIDLW